ADRPAHGGRADRESALRRFLSTDSPVPRQPVVPAARRRLLHGEGLAPIDLEFTGDEMMALANQVVARSVDDILHARDQPSCGDVNASAHCRSLVEPPPEDGVPLEPLLASLFRDWIPRSFTTIGPG